MATLSLPVLDPKIVEQLIPQRKPIIMVDSLLGYQKDSVVAGLAISDDSVFVKEVYFQESGVIEHMAQSVALYTGYQYFLKGQPAPMGYIGAIKQLTIIRLPRVGEQLVTTATVLHEIMGVTLVDVVTKIEGEIIAFGQMKTVIANS
jgi:3-hydroxyacyl-[acyl-carrier-protein] dehydratase